MFSICLYNFNWRLASFLDLKWFDSYSFEIDSLALLVAIKQLWRIITFTVYIVVTSIDSSLWHLRWLETSLVSLLSLLSTIVGDLILILVASTLCASEASHTAENIQLYKSKKCKQIVNKPWPVFNRSKYLFVNWSINFLYSKITYQHNDCKDHSELFVFCIDLIEFKAFETKWKVSVTHRTEDCHH